MAAPRSRIHLPIIAAASASLYAGTLLVVTTAEADRLTAIAEQHQPLQDAASSLAERNDRLEAVMGSVLERYERAADDYRVASDAAADLGERLSLLARGVAGLQGTVAQVRIPARQPLPAPGQVSAPRPRPPVHATTGASGG
jgi:hypothetical protein